MSDTPHSTSNEEDVRTMKSLVDGDEDAFSRIMERWRAPVSSYLYQITGNYETALDLSQDVFLRLYKSRNRYNPDHKFSTWLFTIATNLSKNHFRWKSRHAESQLDSNWGINVTGHDSAHISPASYLEKTETGKEVRDALVALPEKLRIPTILFYYQDMSYADIAKILKCSVKTVENNLYRARKLLKGALSSAEF